MASQAGLAHIIRGALLGVTGRREQDAAAETAERLQSDKFRQALLQEAQKQGGRVELRDSINAAAGERLDKQHDNKLELFREKVRVGDESDLMALIQDTFKDPSKVTEAMIKTLIPPQFQDLVRSAQAEELEISQAAETFTSELSEKRQKGVERDREANRRSRPDRNRGPKVAPSVDSLMREINREDLALRDKFGVEQVNDPAERRKTSVVRVLERELGVVIGRDISEADLDALSDRELALKAITLFENRLKLR